jgi:addiction module RelE/StbE family toxin
MYDARFTKRFDKQFRKLDKQVQRDILEEIEKLRRNPDLGEPLKGNLSGFSKLRVKDYRVIYKPHSSENIMEFVFVEHRRHVYEDLGRLRQEWTI